jgi:hypothetical protein
MSIDGLFYFLQNSQHDDIDLHWWSSTVGSIIPKDFELVYDSVSLIDDNLKIPETKELLGADISNQYVKQIFPNYESWCHFWVVADKQRVYHEERTA